MTPGTIETEATTKTVEVPVAAIIEAAATLRAIPMVADSIRDDGIGPNKELATFEDAAYALMGAAFGEEWGEGDYEGARCEDIWPRTHEIAADWLEALVNTPISLGVLLGLGERIGEYGHGARYWSPSRLREHAKKSREGWYDAPKDGDDA